MKASNIVFVSAPLAFVVTAIALLLTLKTASYKKRGSTQRQSQSNSDSIMVSTVPPVSTQEDDDPFFVFNNGDSTDFFQGFQSFGSQDKVGVNASVLSNYSGQLNNFFYIGSCRTDREQFLIANGVALNNANRKWHVTIDLVQVVNGDVRVGVVASTGTDIVAENNGIRMSVDKTISEIWNLDLVGANPTLLERSLHMHNYHQVI
jgi:hypothetical protein